MINRVQQSLSQLQQPYFGDELTYEKVLKGVYTTTTIARS